jgi:hypothetical protein
MNSMEINRNGKAATPSPLPEIDRTKTGVSGLQND